MKVTVCVAVIVTLCIVARCERIDSSCLTRIRVVVSTGAPVVEDVAVRVSLVMPRYICSVIAVVAVNPNVTPEQTRKLRIVKGQEP